MTPQIGLICTNAPSVAWLRTQLQTANAQALKVVPAWGLEGGWSDAAIREVATFVSTLVVRTTSGDPSYVRPDGKDNRYPLPDESVAEARPFLAVRPDAWIEIGNEPLLADQATEEEAWFYRWHLDATITALRAAFPKARLIAPAHIRNHLIRLGDHADGQGRWDEICADALRRCDALSLHAYTAGQALAGIKQLRHLVSGSMPIWATEFALGGEELEPAVRGRRYRELLDDLPIFGALIYHLDHAGGQDPAHFRPEYRLEPRTLAALAQPVPTHAPVKPMPISSKPAPRGLAALTIRDLRPELEKTRIKDRTPAFRSGKPRGSVLHYNGQAVPGAGSPEAEVRHILTTVARTHQTNPKVQGDTVQYVFGVLSNGQVVQMRDPRRRASHAGHPEANGHHLGIYLPVGALQDATQPQWASFVGLQEALAEEYGWDDPRTALTPHLKWNETLCPGPRLLARLNAYCNADQDDGGLYRVRRDVAAALVREGPGQSFPVALAGRARAWPGDTIDADAVVTGEPVGGNSSWLHRRDGLGFVHISLVEVLN